MARQYFEDIELKAIQGRLVTRLSEHALADSDAIQDLEKLCAGVKLGLHGYRVIMAIRPLIQDVWTSMANDNNPQRFVVERMLRQIDDYLSSWIVLDEGSGDGT